MQQTWEFVTTVLVSNLEHFLEPVNLNNGKVRMNTPTLQKLQPT